MLNGVWSAVISECWPSILHINTRDWDEQWWEWLKATAVNEDVPLWTSPS
jgi:hypothetical protein